MQHDFGSAPTVFGAMNGTHRRHMPTGRKDDPKPEV
jgi:hypothetical protein